MTLRQVEDPRAAADTRASQEALGDRPQDRRLVGAVEFAARRSAIIQ
jgi:hypothetical protein